MKLLARGRVGLGVAIALVALSEWSDRSAPVPSAASPSSTDPHGHAEFTLAPPAGFVQTKSPADTAPTSPGPTVAAEFKLPGDGPDTALASLTVVVSPTNDDLAANIVGARHLLPQAFPDYRSTIDEQIILPSGQQGWLLGGTYTLKGAKVRTIQLELVEHQLSYVVAGLASEMIFDRFDPIFRSTFNTFALQ